jgi:hypothetical protein
MGKGDVLSEWAYKSFWSSRIESETPAVAAWQGYMTPLIQILYGHVFPQQGCRG